MRLVIAFSVIVLLLGLAPMSFGQTDSEQAPEWTGPTFQLESLSGDKMTQDDVFVDGQLYLVDFWATYCRPCSQYLPHLKEMVDKYGDRGFKVVIFCVDEAGNIDTARTMLAGKDYPFTILFDPEAKVQDQLGVSRIPTTVLFSPTGEELWRHVGYSAGVEDDVSAKIDSLLPAEEAAPSE